MDAARAGAESPVGRIEGLHAEAKAALASTANKLRALREEYRTAYGEEQAAWLALRRRVEARDAAREAIRPPAAGKIDPRQELHRRRGELGRQQAELNRLELAVRNLESLWLFLERGDTSLINPSGGGGTADVNLRIVQAQEAERSRLAQEVHDGPAQVLSNAIFQVEYIERIVGKDPRQARIELLSLRDLLRRELGEVRGFIGQLRPPLLDAVGLNGALEETIRQAGSLIHVTVESDLTAPDGRLPDAAQTVALRVAQEALQNVRKHASASKVSVTTRVEGEDWVLEIRDDGRGFDLATATTQGRRHFGVRFMQERAELIGARLDVRSRPGEGTVVRLAIPMGAKETT
ncbi:MAG TPA: sensor histidine kinase [Candidatus Limnocylindrales bacterium]|jgi:two-component system sensor histidine kinase DegS